MVVNAVFSEQVPGQNSLLTGNLTGKNRILVYLGQFSKILIQFTQLK